MKYIIEFNLPEESAELCDSMDGSKMRAALQEIVNDIFRPARKHGYTDQRIQALFDNKDSSRYCKILVTTLEERFWEILRENEVSLE